VKEGTEKKKIETAKHSQFCVLFIFIRSEEMRWSIYYSGEKKGCREFQVIKINWMCYLFDETGKMSGCGVMIAFIDTLVKFISDALKQSYHTFELAEWTL
jgi:hypothetical protein